jgi:hypothetical protein
MWRRAALVFGVLYSGILLYGWFSSEFRLQIYLAGFFVAALAAAISAMMYHIEVARARKRRGQSRFGADVAVTPWLKEGSDYVTTSRWAGVGYELRLMQKLGSWLRADLRSEAGEKIVTIPSFPRDLGGISRLLADGVTGELAGDELHLAHAKKSGGGKQLIIECGKQFSVSHNQITAEGVELARRDVLGWRVKDDISDRDAAVCALVLASRMADLV